MLSVKKLFDTIKQKKKIIFIIFGMFILAMIFLQYNTNVAAINREFEEYNFKDAYKKYSMHCFKTKNYKKQVATKCYDVMDEIIEKCDDGKISYKTASEIFNDGKDFKKDIAGYSSRQSNLSKVEHSKKYYKNGIKYYKDEKYYEAYMNFSKVQKASKKYDESYNKMKECENILVDEMIRESNEYLNRHEYEMAQKAVEGYLKAFLTNDKIIVQLKKVQSNEF